MQDFLAMGGYAAYVWPCFGLTAAVIVANLVAARYRFTRTRQRLARRLARQDLSTGDKA
jgi:heme exporter protein D